MMRVFYGVAVILMAFLMYAFNPSLEKHQKAVMDIFEERVKNEGFGDNNWSEKVALEIGRPLAEKIIQNLIKREDYTVFSLTRTVPLEEKYINENNQKLRDSQIVGIGILGNVFIFAKDINDLPK